MGNILLRNWSTNDETKKIKKNSYFRVTTTSASIPVIVAITVTTGDNGDLVVGTCVGGVVATVLGVAGTVVWTGAVVVTTGAVPVLYAVSLPYALDAVMRTL